MLCRGRPSWDGFAHKACRVDALSRIACAGLAAGCDLNFVFEDCTTLRCTPRLLDVWQVGGGTSAALASSEERLYTMLEVSLANAANGRDSAHPGMCLKFGSRVSTCIQDIMRNSRGHRRFQLVLMLRETGCPLDFVASPPAPTDGTAPVWLDGVAESRASGTLGTLVVLGGVRDLTDVEERAIDEACHRLGIPIGTVSLGHVPELTSKCIKFLEAAAQVGFLRDAFVRCGERGWQGQEPLEHPPRSPMHIIWEVRGQLEKFIKRPEAARLVVDVFRCSHHNYQNTALSLFDSGGMALTLLNRDLSDVLHEADAMGLLRAQLVRARPQTLAQVMSAEYDRLSRCRGLRVGRLIVLHADPAAPVLRRAPRAVDDSSTAVVAIFAGAALTGAINTACSKANRLERASVGPLLSGPAFVSLLHNEGLLIPMIDPGPQRTPLPTPKRLAAPPKVGGAGRPGSVEGLVDVVEEAAEVEAESPLEAGATAVSEATVEAEAAVEAEADTDLEQEWEEDWESAEEGPVDLPEAGKANVGDDSDSEDWSTIDNWWPEREEVKPQRPPDIIAADCREAKKAPQPPPVAKAAPKRSGAKPCPPPPTGRAPAAPRSGPPPAKASPARSSPADRAAPQLPPEPKQPPPPPPPSAFAKAGLPAASEPWPALGAHPADTDWQVARSRKKGVK